ncbi:MAG: hypothetical protein AAF353_07575 [Pseudomonadota bacterium]
MSPNRSQVGFTIIMLFCLLLAGCGGGGGGGSDGEFSVSGGVEINTSAIRFDAVNNGALPPIQEYTISWTNSDIAAVLVGVPPGEVPPGWLDIDLIGIDSPLTLRLSVNSTSLGPGIYGFTLRIVSADIDGFILDLIDVPLEFHVLDVLGTSTPVINAEYVIGAPPLATIPVSISGAGIPWQASVSQPWATLDATSGTAFSSPRLTLDPTGLPLGLNQAEIEVVNQNDTSERITIDINFTVSEPSVQVSQINLNFSGTNYRSNELADQDVDFALTNTLSSNWTAVASDPWITLNQTNWTGPDTVSIGIDPDAGNLASGSHSGTVTLSTIWMGTPLNAVIPVDLTLTPATVSAFPSPLMFEGSSSADIGSQTVFLSVNTFPNSYPWSLTPTTNSGGNWLESSALSGTVSQIQATPEISINTAGLPGGNYTGSLDFSVQVNGDSLPFSIPVQLQLEDNRLLIEDNGVALVSTPTIARLSHSVTVRENRDAGGMTPWDAVSDQAWLGVTASGVTGSNLTLTANPAGLALDTVHYATVTVTSTDPTIASGDTVKVGFYVSNTAPVTQVTNTAPSLGLTASGLIADPIRPYAYVTNRTGTIDVYHTYTGALLTPIITGATDLRNLAISSDGQRLFAPDYAGGGIFNIDLNDAATVVNSAWTDPAWTDCSCNTSFISDLDYTRIKGRGVLIGSAHDIVDALTGVRLYPADSQNFIGSPVLQDITESGKVLFSVRTNSSPHLLRRQAIEYDAFGDQFSLTETHSATKSSFSRGVSTDAIGDFLYRACWYPLSEVEVYDGTDLTTISTITGGTNGSALLAEDGLLYCTRHYTDAVVPGVPDVWSVDPTNNVVAQEYNIDGVVLEGRYAISGDGQRLITRSDLNQTNITMTTIP